MSELRTNRIVPRDGLPAGATGGGILQCVQTVYKGTQAITTNLSGFTAISDFNTQITPSSSSSKILVRLNLFCSDKYYQVKGNLTRNGTAVSDAKGTGQSNRPGCWFSRIRYGDGSSSDYDMSPISAEYIDSPGTTSPTTYSIELGGYSDLHPVYINRNIAFQDTSGYDYIPMSTLTVFEISA